MSRHLWLIAGAALLLAYGVARQGLRTEDSPVATPIAGRETSAERRAADPTSSSAWNRLRTPQPLAQPPDTGPIPLGLAEETPPSEARSAPVAARPAAVGADPRVAPRAPPPPANPSQATIAIGPILDADDPDALLASAPSGVPMEVGAPLDADDDMDVAALGQNNDPVQVGLPLEPDDDPAVDVGEPDREPTEVGLPMDADDRDLEVGWPEAAEAVHVGPDLDADIGPDEN